MNRSTIDRLYRRTYSHLLATAFSILRHRQDAEDVVQDAFVSLLEGQTDAVAMPIEAWLEAEVIRLCQEEAPASTSTVQALRPPARAIKSAA